MCGGVEVGEVAVLPAPSNLGGWPSFERKGPRRRTPDARFGDKILAPTQLNLPRNKHRYRHWLSWHFSRPLP